ncbi:uncharacterized protein LOC133929664 [Phragmites australis]|uniref:uncharacterized protein LOC133929664 n=1 Tax=Phragmites australis TaxID=29695 RepID=UPI002D77133C|nr:uncharacterized protein LOC133929664 [Phragmites australis]
MAPPWVLLHRIVHFVDGGAAVNGGTSKGGGGGVTGDSDPYASPLGALEAMEPNPAIVDPPQVTYLTMLTQTPAEQMPRVRFGVISSTDKGLVVLYTGSYRPGSGCLAGDGGYLVYDASNNSLSAIPPLPDSPASTSPLPGLPTTNTKCLGRSAAIMRLGHGGEGAYVLAELVTSYWDSGLPDADLCLWWWWSSSTTNPAGQWIRKAVRLPLPSALFSIDMAFSCAGSRVCWVDLFTGVLICDLFTPQGPEFSFIPLPEGHCQYTPNNRRLCPNPEAFRSMGCVCGAIKFVAVMDYSQGMPSNERALKTWNLSPDFKEWKEGSALPVGDLWASESFNEMGLPRVRPRCPVLSTNEDEVIYIALNDIEYVDNANVFEEFTGRRPVLKAHYMLRLDLLQNKVLSSDKSSGNNLALLAPMLLASDLSAYRHRSKDHKRGEEAC